MKKENKMPKYLLSTEGVVYETCDLVKCNHPDYPKLWFTEGGAPLDEEKLSDDLYALFDQLVVIFKCDDGRDLHELLTPACGLNYQRELLFHGSVTKVYGAVWRSDGLKYVAVLESSKAPWRKL